MYTKELISWLGAEYPLSAAEEWDNVGLLVGSDAGEVTHVFLALDLTDETLNEAIEAGADMIITHHPMIFSGMKKITDNDFTGRKIIRLIQHNIPYYAMHTNYDVMGMAELSADYLKLTDREVLSVTRTDGDHEEGFGRVGSLPRKMTLRECAAYVKDALMLPEVKVFGDPDAMAERASVCTGSGKSMIREAIKKGSQVYITGDIDHHSGIDAVAMGLNIIDAGHYGTEYIFMADLDKRLTGRFPDLKISRATVKFPYFMMF